MSMMPESGDSDIQGASLEKKDYVAIFIAMMQTVFLPLIAIMGVFLILGLLFVIIGGL
jgi:hypothetical protein